MLVGKYIWFFSGYKRKERKKKRKKKRKKEKKKERKKERENDGRGYSKRNPF
jgi:hypothetical protein